MISKVKDYIIIIFGILLILLSIVGFIEYKQIDKLKDDLAVAVNNNKAYENDKLQFQYTVRQMERSEDSINQLLIKTRDSLGLSKRKVQEYFWYKQNFNKRDSIYCYITDSIPIFIESLYLDTTIGDMWYQANIHLEYPNMLVFEPSFTSENIIITDIRRETINPPRKTKFGRFFQRKHNLIETNVVNRNPYCKLDTLKSIKIIK